MILDNVPGFSVRNALCAASACQAAYDIGDLSAFPGATLYQAADLQYLLADAGDVQLLAIAGSRNAGNWITNLNVVQRPSPIFPGLFHAGFLDAADVLWDNVAPRLIPGKSVLIGGHSLGGPLAALTKARLIVGKVAPVHSCYTCGSPRFADPSFAAYYAGLDGGDYRIVNGIDMFPAIPTKVMFLGGLTFHYEHVGSLQWFSHDGTLKRMLSMPHDEVMLAGISDVRQLNLMPDHLIRAYVETLTKAVQL